MSNDNHPSCAAGLALTVAAQAIGARNAAAPAIVWIGSGVHALLSTNRLFRRANQTCAAQADAGCADVVAAATVLVVGGQVHALFVAVDQWLRALKWAGVVPTCVGLGCVAAGVVGNAAVCKQGHWPVCGRIHGIQAADTEH